MKWCNKCQTNKDESEFRKDNNRKDGLHYLCKLCMSEYGKLHYNKNKAAVLEQSKKRQENQKLLMEDYLSDKCCSLCGEDENCCLDFHHKDPEQKEFGIGGLKQKWITIENEIKKCVILCSNCHRKLHYGSLKNINVEQLVVGSA